MAYPGEIPTGNTLVLNAANDRRVDYTQNGVYWAMFQDSTAGSMGYRFFYSPDRGQSWAENTSMKILGNQNQAGNIQAAFFIDKDDYLHVLYVDDLDISNVSYFYVRGTPNAARTHYDWSTPVEMTGWTATIVGTIGVGCSIVVHREGTGWVAHCFAAINPTSSATTIEYRRVTLDVSGTPSLGSSTTLLAPGASANAWISSDFRHTADPKAVQASTPSVYVHYCTPAAGTGDTRFRKIAYSAGVWTPGTERIIGTASEVGPGNFLVYDGTRIVMTYVSFATNTVVRVSERDEADTATTVRDPTVLSDGTVDSLSLGCDYLEDIYLVAQAETSDDFKKIKFDRSAGTWAGSWTVLEAQTVTPDGSANVMRYLPLDLGGEALLAMIIVPDEIHSYALVSNHQGTGTLQSVGSITPNPTIGIASSASLQGVGKMTPQESQGFGGVATLRGIGTLDVNALLTPKQDFTVYDGYLVDPNEDEVLKFIYHDSPDTRKDTATVPLRPPRTDTGLDPTEVRPESGDTFSQQDFSHGAGQLYFHHEDRDVKRFLWCEGFDLDIDTVGQPSILQHLHDVPAAAFTSATVGRIEVFNDLPFVIDGSNVKRGSGAFPGFWTDEDPGDGDPTDFVSSGEFLYAALGVGGIHRRTTAGVWAHWSDVPATRVGWVKNRILAADGRSIYEVVSGGAVPTALETLPVGWVFEDIFEAGGFIYAIAASITSGLSRIHTYGLNENQSALEKKNETPFPRGQVMLSGRGYLGVVYLGGGIKNDAGGYDPVAYQAFPQDDGSLTYAKVAEGEGAGAQDLSVMAFEPIGEDVLFGWSLGSGFDFGARDGLAVHKLKVGAFLPHLKKAGAGEGRQVLGIAFYKGRVLFTLKGSGLYYEDIATYVQDAYLVSSIADWNTTARKVWDLFQVSHEIHALGSNIALDYTTAHPAKGDWHQVVAHGISEEVHEAHVDNLTARALAVRIRTTASTDRTQAVSGPGFLVRSNVQPDTTEWNIVRFVRLLNVDRKDAQGEEVNIDVEDVRARIHAMAHKRATLYEPGVVWSGRITDIREVEPYGPIFEATEGESRRQGYILKLTMIGNR